MFYRHEVINRLQQTHSLVTIVADNLDKYMKKIRTLAKSKISSQYIIIYNNNNNNDCVLVALIAVF